MTERSPSHSVIDSPALGLWHNSLTSAVWFSTIGCSSCCHTICLKQTLEPMALPGTSLNKPASSFSPIVFWMYKLRDWKTAYLTRTGVNVFHSSKTFSIDFKMLKKLLFLFPPLGGSTSVCVVQYDLCLFAVDPCVGEGWAWTQSRAPLTPGPHFRHPALGRLKEHPWDWIRTFGLHLSHPQHQRRGRLWEPETGVSTHTSCRGNQHLPTAKETFLTSKLLRQFPVASLSLPPTSLSPVLKRISWAGETREFQKHSFVIMYLTCNFWETQNTGGQKHCYMLLPLGVAITS